MAFKDVEVNYSVSQSVGLVPIVKMKVTRYLMLLLMQEQEDLVSCCSCYLVDQKNGSLPW